MRSLPFALSHDGYPTIMDDRDQATHSGLTRLHAKLETLSFAQAESLATLDRLRLQREGRWPDDVEKRATTP